MTQLQHQGDHSPPQVYLRPSLDYQRIFQELKGAGSLVRIRSPHRFGKTLLLRDILNQNWSSDDRHVILDLRKIDRTLLTSSTQFLRALCLYVSRSLGFVATLDDDWDEDLGAKLNCSFYFEEYLLERLDGDRLILVLENLDLLFEYPVTAKEILPLLRSWYEEGKRSPIWGRLSLIVTYATEIYVALDVQQSPFNVGLAITLQGFDTTDILELARRYNFRWTEAVADYVQQMLGGHPYLTRLTLDYAKKQAIANSEDPQAWLHWLEEHFACALHNNKIYRNHFTNLWRTLTQYPQLMEALWLCLETSEPVSLTAIAAYRLESMGLVERDGSKVKLRGDFYRQYFQVQLQALRQKPDNPDLELIQMALAEQRLEELEQENMQLRSLAQRDGLTNLYNRRSFDAIFATQWQVAMDKQQPLLLLVCDIDYFKPYNDNYGHRAGDQALVKVAEVLLKLKSDFSDCIARYGGEEFVFLRLVQDRAEAVALAENLRQRVEGLKLPHQDSLSGLPSRFVTVSVGGSLWTPKLGEQRQAFFEAADTMLYQAKQEGRNRVCWDFKRERRIA